MINIIQNHCVCIKEEYYKILVEEEINVKDFVNDSPRNMIEQKLGKIWKMKIYKTKIGQLIGEYYFDILVFTTIITTCVVIHKVKLEPITSIMICLISLSLLYQIIIRNDIRILNKLIREKKENEKM